MVNGPSFVPTRSKWWPRQMLNAFHGILHLDPCWAPNWFWCLARGHCRRTYLCFGRDLDCLLPAQPPPRHHPGTRIVTHFTVETFLGKSNILVNKSGMNRGWTYHPERNSSAPPPPPGCMPPSPDSFPAAFAPPSSFSAPTAPSGCPQCNPHIWHLTESILDLMNMGW